MLTTTNNENWQRPFQKSQGYPLPCILRPTLTPSVFSTVQLPLLLRLFLSTYTCVQVFPILRNSHSLAEACLHQPSNPNTCRGPLISHQDTKNDVQKVQLLLCRWRWYNEEMLGNSPTSYCLTKGRRDPWRMKQCKEVRGIGCEVGCEDTRGGTWPRGTAQDEEQKRSKDSILILFHSRQSS